MTNYNEQGHFFDDENWYIDENGELRRDDATVEFEDGVDYVCVDGIWKPIYLHYDEDLDDEDIDDGDVDSGE